MEQPPASDAADWSKLPADILTTVMCALEFPDLFNSAAACTSWRATARALRRLGGTYSRPQTPCLFYTSPTGAELYSLAAGKSYRLPDIPDPLLLLNPATGEQIGLPPIATIEQVTPVHDDAGSLQRYELSFYDATLPRKELQPPVPYEVGELREVLYLKVILSGDPSRGDCTAMLIHNPDRQLSFARVGGEQWHWITTSPKHTEYSDCIYQDGVFYAMTRQGGIHRYTISGSSASCEVVFKNILPFMAYNVYIARASSGDVLQIWRYIGLPSEETKEMRTDGFEIFKLDFDKQCIVKANTLGDDALLIGHSYTCCLSTKDYPKLLPSHVYFTDDSEYWPLENKNCRRDVGICNLEEESFGDLVSPQPWLNWPNPIWIMPSFTKINQ
ncbi:hypothetical protein ACP70R_020451 [Stipagrostis hirtigluma subsp. patula]